MTVVIDALATGMDAWRYRVVGLLVFGAGLWLLGRQAMAAGHHLHAASLLYAEGHVFHPAVVQSGVQLLLLVLFTMLAASGVLLLVIYDG